MAKGRVERSVIEEIQKLAGSHSEDFTEDTILGSDINQIRHLFYWLRSEQRPVQVSYGAEVYKARVEEVVASRALLRIPGFREERARRCRIKFEIVNILYQFEVPILDLGEESLSIKIPAFIQSAKLRKYRRIFVDDMFMRWVILYQPLFGRRGTGQILEARYPYVITELHKPEPDLQLVNRIVAEELSRISPAFQIVFYEPDRQRSLMENVISEERKTLFVADVTSVESYFRPIRQHGLINFHREYVEMLRHSSEEEAAKYFERKRQADMQALLANYVCAPLMIFDNVVGHIYVHSSVFDRGLIGADQAFHVDLLAQLLNYAMSKTVIARSYYRHTFSRVVNISMGGLLFELTNREIFDYLTYHDHLKMMIQIKHHMLELDGEITRYYPTKDGFNIGVKFYKSGPDDFRVLENFIYDRGRSTFE